MSGSTSLPDQTRITVTALRNFEAEPIDAILDRQFATVRQGSWQASLNLWQVAPDGRYQESWQLSDLPPSSEPTSTVTFLATLDPVNQPPGLKDQVEAQDEATQVTLVRFTTDGELYLEASKQIDVPLPNSRTTPPEPLAPVPLRTSDRPAPPTAERNQDWSQTSAPLSPSQQFR